MSSCQHFIDALVDNDGFSAQFKNGKPVRQKDKHKSSSIVGSSWITKNKSGVIVGTASDTALTIADRKRPIKVFATRYGPNVNIAYVKSDLQNKLKLTTGIDHDVNVERVQSKYDSYSSFKITCLCSDVSVIYNPAIWPKDCFVKRWRDPRNSRGGIIGASSSSSSK